MKRSLGFIVVIEHALALALFFAWIPELRCLSKRLKLLGRNFRSSRNWNVNIIARCALFSLRGIIKMNESISIRNKVWKTKKYIMERFINKEESLHFANRILEKKQTFYVERKE